MTRFPKALLVACIVSTTLPSWASEKKLPEFAKVEGVVRRHFATLPGFQSGDLISRTQVRPIFAAIERLGWNVADQAAVLNSVLPDSNYLVQEFRTPDGQEFMRKVAGTPLAFDRLDQISRLPGGKLMVKDFLRFPNAELTLTKNKAMNVGRFARFQPKDKQTGITPSDLDKPTGRAYTVDGLVARLRLSYEAEVKRRAESQR